MKSQYKLIALDLDDTLLSHALIVSDENCKAIQEAMNMGVHIVLASGRNLYGMKVHAERLGLMNSTNWIVATNGSEIVELPSGKVLEETRISPELCHEVENYLIEKDFPYQIYENGKIYVSHDNEWTRKDTELTGQEGVVTTDFKSAFARGQLKFVVSGQSEAISALYGEIKEHFKDKLVFLISKPYFLEVLPLGVDKGTALERLCLHLGVKREEVLACGDAMNDLGMLSWAGTAAVPFNAIPEAKELADYISPKTNDESAVADIVTKIVLNSAKI